MLASIPSWDKYSNLQSRQSQENISHATWENPDNSEELPWANRSQSGAIVKTAVNLQFFLWNHSQTLYRWPLQMIKAIIAYVVVFFLSDVIFVFLLFLGMVKCTLMKLKQKKNKTYQR